MADEPRPDDAAPKAAPSQSRKLPHDETVEGGRYLNDSGDLVDADGQPLKKGKE